LLTVPLVWFVELEVVELVVFEVVFVTFEVVLDDPVELVVVVDPVVFWDPVVFEVVLLVLFVVLDADELEVVVEFVVWGELGVLPV